MSKTKNVDLNGNAPDKCPVALLLIDMINTLDFPGGTSILKHAIPAAKSIARLKERCRRSGIPAIYVNDNFGRWRSDFKNLLKHSSENNLPGRFLAQLLPPSDNDYFVLKPKHSGFFATTLNTLLRYLGAKTLILTGICGDICVLFTANDAYMRDFNIIVPSDCVASRTVMANRAALAFMQDILKADTRSSHSLVLKKLVCGCAKKVT